MKRVAVLLTSFTTLIALGGPPPALAVDAVGGSPGSVGIGDNYFPSDGNGGYDAKHYTLDVRYDPDTDRISGSSTMTAVAQKNLSRFNLDLAGLKVHSISVNRQPATWQRHGDELVITPSEVIAKDNYPFVTKVRYSGVP
jgi:aminopeptidase N